MCLFCVRRVISCGKESHSIKLVLIEQLIEDLSGRTSIVSLTQQIEHCQGFVSFF